MKRPLESAFVVRLFVLLLIASLPAVGEGQDFTYSTNGTGGIQILKYTGSDNDVTIPASMDGRNVRSIEDFAFQGCGGVTNVTVPSTVDTITSYAFYECPCLLSVTVSDLNSTYSSVDGVLFNKSQTTLLLYPQARTGEYSVSGTVTAIGDLSFVHCGQLTGISLPESITNIGYAAFAWCTAIEGVTIPTNVTSIGNSVFSDCTSLTNVIIPASVVELGLGPFSRCSSLAAIVVDALNPNYSSVDGVLFDKTQTTLIQYPGGKAGSYAVPGSVATIKASAFDHCVNLTGMSIPAGVTNIELGAFTACCSLPSILVDGLNPNYSSVDGVLFDKSGSVLLAYPDGKGAVYAIPDGVTRIESGAFAECSTLTDVTIPDSVVSIGDSAFHTCSNLTSVVIPNSVTNLGAAAFQGCSHLADAATGDGVSELAVETFGDCVALTNLTIGAGVKGFGYHVFWGCASLARIVMPDSVTNVSYGLFRDCSNMTAVCFAGDAPSVDTSAFVGAENATVYYLAGTTGWGPTFGGRPTALWNPRIETVSAETDSFAFTMTGISNMSVIVECCTNLTEAAWMPLSTNPLVNGASSFADPGWTDQPCRFYRLRML